MRFSPEIRTTTKQASKKSTKKHRIFLIGIFTLYALIGWLRLHESLTYWHYLLELNFWPRPLYLTITGGLIGLFFSLADFMYLFKIRFAPQYSRYLSILFLVWFWVDRIWFSTREAFFNQLEVSVIITLVTLFWSFILIRKKDFYRKNNQQEENGKQTGTGSQILPE